MKVRSALCKSITTRKCMPVVAGARRLTYFQNNSSVTVPSPQSHFFTKGQQCPLSVTSNGKTRLDLSDLVSEIYNETYFPFCWSLYQGCTNFSHDLLHIVLTRTSQLAIVSDKLCGRAHISIFESIEFRVPNYHLTSSTQHANLEQSHRAQNSRLCHHRSLALPLNQ